MSVNRRCPKCFKEEGMRVNFGDNYQAESEFHHQEWCDHKYGLTPQQMIEKGYSLKDEMWIAIARNFLAFYNQRIENREKMEEAEKVKIFLSQLKDSVSTFDLDIYLKKIQ